MTITARFSSWCPRCHQHIEAGERVEWTPGEKATHPNCQPAPAEPVVERIAVEDAGVYVLPDGAIVQIKQTRDKLRTYPKLWTAIGGTRVTEAGTFRNGEYVYPENPDERAELVRRVQETGHKMTLDEAKSFTILYGRCARCPRTLKDRDSVLDGFGPVCITYFGGKHGQTRRAAKVTAAKAPREWNEDTDPAPEDPRSPHYVTRRRRSYEELFGDN